MKLSALAPSAVGRCFRHLVLARYSTATPVKSAKPRNPADRNERFVDFRQVRVQGGKGGDGCVSFLSLFANEFAGPDGGDGGHGGHVIFKATTNHKSLGHVYPLLKAEDGGRGTGKDCHGKNAGHRVVEMPIGTLVKTTEGVLLHDLAREGDLYVAARGGAGGHGNAFFLSNEVRAPTTYEEGAVGEERELFVELSVIAHVGLVGFPNAGKSTLLRAISRARPKVAAYPFTTRRPHVGVVQYDDQVQVAVADIPGLIPGAHLNRGLGFAFLRHVQRCYCLLYVLDLSVDRPWEQFSALRTELELYETGLSTRPHAIVANKMDLPIARENLELLREKLREEEGLNGEEGGIRFIPVSAREGLNIKQLLIHVRELYDKHDVSSEG